MELLQEIFTKAQAGEDEVIAPYVADKVLDVVEEQEEMLANKEAYLAAGGDPLAYEFIYGRRGFAPEQGELSACALIRPSFEGTYFPERGITLHAPFDARDCILENHVQAGDFVCGIGWESPTPEGMTYHYWLWWLVRTDADGTPFIYRAGTEFG